MPATRAATLSFSSEMALMAGSRAFRVDGQRELLGAARDLGDRPLGHVVEAVDLLQLGGDLVYRGPRVDRPLHERLLGADVELAHVQLDLVGGRDLARD